jgi:hypothetical protein
LPSANGNFMVLESGTHHGGKVDTQSVGGVGVWTRGDTGGRTSLRLLWTDAIMVIKRVGEERTARVCRHSARRAVPTRRCRDGWIFEYSSAN